MIVMYHYTFTFKTLRAGRHEYRASIFNRNTGERTLLSGIDNATDRVLINAMHHFATLAKTGDATIEFHYDVT